MLSKTLSVVFMIAALVIATVCIISVTAQLTQQTPSALASGNQVFAFGEPGIEVAARKKELKDQVTGNVLFHVEVADSSGNNPSSSSGMLSAADDLPLFTKDPLVASIQNNQQPAGNKTLVSKNLVIEKFRVLPANHWQRAGLVLYDLLRFGCPALMCFVVAGLFRNFSRQQYFTLRNVQLVKTSGWLLILPQLVSALVFLLFLYIMPPVPVWDGSAAGTTSLGLYNVQSDINWSILFLAPCLIVASYIFHNGQLMQEDQALCV